MNEEGEVTRPDRSLRSFHIVTKTVGATCNLHCSYCYYLYKESLLGSSGSGHSRRISDEQLETFICQYIAGQDHDTVLFNWHGGEPALLGLDFYRKAVALQRKYADGKQIKNDFQTNGVLLDEAWCEFFKQHGFHVGLSIDGPRELHDRYRRDRGGTATFDRVFRAAQLLRQYQVPFNALTVVSAANARQPAEVYTFLTEDLGCRRLQWLPCVAHRDFETTAPGRWPLDRMPILGTTAARPGQADALVTNWSVDPDDWGEFLCRTFDLWLRDNFAAQAPSPPAPLPPGASGGMQSAKRRGGKVSVNWFDSFLQQWMGKPARICSLAPVCGRSLVTLETDGGLYSCDHFVYPEYRLGTLGEPGRDLVDIVYSDQQRIFGEAKHKSLPAYCRRCSYNFACNGECPKNRFLRTPDGEPGLNYLCSGIKRFLTYADPHLRQIVARLHGSGTAQVGV